MWNFPSCCFAADTVTFSEAKALKQYYDFLMTISSHPRVYPTMLRDVQTKFIEEVSFRKLNVSVKKKRKCSFRLYCSKGRVFEKKSAIKKLTAPLTAAEFYSETCSDARRTFKYPAAAWRRARFSSLKAILCSVHSLTAWIIVLLSRNPPHRSLSIAFHHQVSLTYTVHREKIASKSAIEIDESRLLAKGTEGAILFKWNRSINIGATERKDCYVNRGFLPQNDWYFVIYSTCRNLAHIHIVI